MIHSMPYCTAFDDSPLYYEEHGDPGLPTLLLLPGLLGSIQMQWRAFISPLAEQYHVVATDLRGHGRSRNSAGSLHISDMVRDTALLMDTLNIATAHIGGYSLGGYIGLQLHLEQPERVQTLLMHATKFYWSDAVAAGMKKQMNPEAIRAKVPKYAEQLAVEHGEERWPQLLQEASVMVEGLPSGGLQEADAARATCPIVVSTGDRDELIPIEESVRLSRAIPSAQLMVLPGVRHPFPGIPPSLMMEAMRLFHCNR